jgi:glycosyltransferase involved in cell wall biosynthesis
VTDFRPWRIIHLQVETELPGLEADPTSGGVLLVLWRGALPLGELSIPDSLLPLTSSQVAEMIVYPIAPVVGNRLIDGAFPPPDDLADHAPSPMTLLETLVTLESPLAACSQRRPIDRSDQSESSGPSTSLVICTRNRPAALRACLLSIRQLQPQPDEILVVDNDPGSGLTRAVAADFPEVRYLAEARSGLSVARNTGVRNSSGTVIAFTDDDVTVHPAWLGILRRVLAGPDVLAATGLVLPAELNTPAQFTFQHAYAWDYRPSTFGPDFFRRRRANGVPAWRLGAGANMAFRREAFDRVGLFDERLGAGASGCSEDSELWYRLLAQGHRCRYEPAAVVFHTHRSTWAELSDQTFSYMRGHVAALLFQFDRSRDLGNLYRAFLAIPLDVLRLVFRAFKRAVLTEGDVGDSLVLPFWPQVRGALSGYTYYLRYRNVRPVGPD